MKQILLSVFLLIVTIVSYSQTLHYKITSNDSYIGKLEVTKSTTNNLLQIEVLSQVKVNLFIAIDFTYKLNCTYKNNELLFSSVTTYVNGKVHSTTTTEKDGAYYSVTKDEHPLKYLDKIFYSGALLYFTEPKGVTKIFSEFDGISKPITEINKNEYQIRNPKNDHLSEYRYKNGILQSSVNHHRLMTFTLTKI